MHEGVFGVRNVWKHAGEDSREGRKKGRGEESPNPLTCSRSKSKKSHLCFEKKTATATSKTLQTATGMQISCNQLTPTLTLALTALCSSGSISEKKTLEVIPNGIYWEASLKDRSLTHREAFQAFQNWTIHSIHSSCPAGCSRVLPAL